MRNVIVTVDGGCAWMDAFQVRQRHGSHPWLRARGSGTMGFAFPAAIGAQFGHPGKEVWAVVSAASFQMTMCELATAAIHKLPVNVIVFNHSASESVGNPDFSALARAFSGALGLNLRRASDIRRVLQRARDHTAGPCVINVGGLPVA